jgi:hypothetical protein
VSPDLAPLGPGEELIDVESFRRLHSGIADTAPARRAAPPEIELVHRLTREEVERTAVKRARAHAEAAAFFLARRGRIQATCCDPGTPLDLEPIHWIGRRFALASVLEQQVPYCGTPWRDPLTGRIVRAIGRDGVREIALFPISVYGRPVAILYADAGSRPFAARSLRALSSNCSDIAGIFERMLVERKRDQTPGSA